MPPLTVEESEERVSAQVTLYLEEFLDTKSVRASEQLIRLADSIDNLLSCLLRDNNEGHRLNDGIIVREVISPRAHYLLVKGECWHIDQYKEPFLAELLVDSNTKALAAYRIRFGDAQAGYGDDGLSFDYDRQPLPENYTCWKHAFDKGIGRLHNN